MGCLVFILLALFGFTGFVGVATQDVFDQVLMELNEPQVVEVVEAEPDRYLDTYRYRRMDDQAFVIGEPDAPVRVVVAVDYLCPHCQSYESTVSRIIVEYASRGMVQVEHRSLLAIDPISSAVAAQLVECADTLQPGSFWDARANMFELASSQVFNEATVLQFIAERGLNQDATVDCVATAEQYIRDSQYLQQFDDITGTPSVLVFYAGDSERVNESLFLTYEELVQLIEAGQ